VTVRNDQIRAHLEFFAELGVDGLRPEPVWRSRIEGARDTTVAPEAPQPHETPPPPDASPLPADLVTVLAAGEAALRVLRADIGDDCSRCKLHALGRRQVVFGVGNPAADLMFVGEAPGADEDLQGEPFVGRAGQLLTKMIQGMGFGRDEVYIANVLKCRPPGNRNPEPDEVASCQPFLFRQIASVRPTVIVTLGAFAARALLDTQAPVSRLRGRIYDVHGAKLIPTFHPSFLLRSPGYKREAWEDLKKALVVLDREPPRPFQSTSDG